MSKKVDKAIIKLAECIDSIEAYIIPQWVRLKPDFRTRKKLIEEILDK